LDYEQALSPPPDNGVPTLTAAGIDKNLAKRARPRVPPQMLRIGTPAAHARNKSSQIGT
jgi:hypothetical protein